MTDVIVLDGILVAMTLFARPDPNVKDSLMFDARLTWEEQLGGPLLARLGWSHRSLSAPVEASGKATFGGIRLDSLIDPNSGEAISGLQIAIERVPTLPG